MTVLLTPRYLQVMAGQELCCLPLDLIKEIKDCTNLTAVPLMPIFMAGICSYQGQIIPVIDVSYQVTGHHADASARSIIIVIEFNDSTYGLLVECVDCIIDAPLASAPILDIGGLLSIQPAIQKITIERMGNV